MSAKLSFAFLLFFFLPVTTALADEPEHGFEIRLAPASGVFSQLPGEPVTINGEIWYREAKNKNNHGGKILSQLLQEKGVQLRAYFPTMANEVTSSLVLDENAHDIRFTTPALAATGANTLYVVISKIADQEVMAETRLPLMVGSQVAAPGYTSSVQAGFRITVTSERGAVRTGENVAITASVTNLATAASSGLILDYRWLGMYAHDIGPLSIGAGQTVSYTYTAQNLQPGNWDANKFHVLLNHFNMQTGQYGARFAKLGLQIGVGEAVNVDAEPPVLLAFSPTDGSILDSRIFNVTGSFDEPVSAVSVNGVAMTVNGSAFSGQVAVAQDGLAQLAIAATDENANTLNTSVRLLVLSGIDQDPDTMLAGDPGSSLVVQPAVLPAQLSTALSDKLSASTAAVAVITNRTDAYACPSSTTLTPPADINNALVSFDAVSEITPTLQALAANLSTPENAFFYVRDQIRFLPRLGLTQTAHSTVANGVGTSVDKANLLMTLLRAQGVPAQLVTGEILINEEYLKNTLGVASANDLSWAAMTLMRGFYLSRFGQTNLDAEPGVLYRNGVRNWVLPHVWVYAGLPVANGGREWVEFDPLRVALAYDRSQTGLSETLNPSSSFYNDYFFAADSSGSFIRNKNILEAMLDTAGTGFDVTQSPLPFFGSSVYETVAFAPTGTVGTETCRQNVSNFVPDRVTLKSFVRVKDWAGTTTHIQNFTSTALVHESPYALSHTAGLIAHLPGETTGALVLSRNGVEVARAENLRLDAALSIEHGFVEPEDYGGLVTSRKTPGQIAGGVNVISHRVLPLNQEAVQESLRDVAFATGSSEQQRTIDALKLVSDYALVKQAEVDRVVSNLKGVYRNTESLLVASTRDGYLMPNNFNALGVQLTKATIDWKIAGPLYSRLGDDDEFASYLNLAKARGDAVIAGSFIEQQVFEDLFGTPSVSSVKLLNRAAEQIAAGGSSLSLIQGEVLSDATSAALYAQFGAGMQAQQTLLDGYKPQSPKLYAVSDSVTSDGFTGVAFIVYPTQPNGAAAAFIANVVTGSLLGGWVDSPGSSVCEPQSHSIGEDFVCYHSEATHTVSSQVSTYYSRYSVRTATFNEQTSLYDFIDEMSWTQCSCRHSNPEPCYCGSCNTIIKNSFELLEQSCLSFESGGFGQPPAAAPFPAGWPGAVANTGGSSTEAGTFPNSIASYVDPLNGNNLRGQTREGTPANTQGNKSQCSLAQPVVASTGHMWHSFIDFNLRGRSEGTKLVFQRTYTSEPSTEAGDLGSNWRHSFESRLYSVPGAQANPDIVWIDPNGGAWTFKRSADDILFRPNGSDDILTEFETHYELRRLDMSVWKFSRNDSALHDGLLTEIKDRYGQTIQFGYDSNSKLTTVSTALAGTIRFERNATGLVNRVLRERDNLAYIFEYDVQNRMTSSTDHLNRTTHYEYNQTQQGMKAHGLLSAIVDPIGRRIEYKYYNNGQSFEQTEPGDGYTSFQYSAPNASTKFTRIRGIDGNTLEYRFDSLGRITEILHPDASRERFAWDSFGRQTDVYDQLGFHRVYSYDGWNNVTRIAYDGSPLTQNFSYHPQSNLLISANGSQIQRDFYTGAITLLRDNSDTYVEEDGLGNIKRLYNSFGNPAYSYEFAYDQDGLLIQVPDARNPETRVYDSRARLIRREFANGRAITLQYNDDDQITQTTDTHGPTVFQGYDLIGRLTSRIVTNGIIPQETRYEWDARDRLISITNPNNETTRFRYDRPIVGCGITDKPVEIIDPAGRSTKFDVDNLGRVVRTIATDGSITRYEYNARGDLTAVTDGQGTRTTFARDAFGNVSRQERPVLYKNQTGQVISDIETTYTTYGGYPGNFLPSQVYKNYGNGNYPNAFAGYSYTGGSRLLLNSIVHSLGFSSFEPPKQTFSSISWAPRVDVNLMTSAENNDFRLDFTYEPTPPFGMTSFTLTNKDASNSLGLLTGTYTVTRAVTGGIASVTDPTGREIYSQTFDAAGRLLGVSSEYFEDHPVSIAIAYDGFGRKQSVTHETGLTGTYAYDILNRVTSIAWSGSDGSSTQAMTQGLAYNTAGNITSQQREHGLFTYNYDSIDQLTAVAFSGAAALDAAIVNRTWTYDRVGNRIGDTLNGAGSFQHNILTENDKYEYVPSVDGSGALGERINKLTGEVETFSYRADGRLKAYENNTQKVEYVLDPLGRRIAKKVTNKSDNTTFNQSFLHLGAEDRVLFAKSGDGKQYLYLDGQGIDEHLAEVSATHVKSYATDHLGSVLNTSTAGSNNVYGPWGETIGVSAQQALTPNTVPINYAHQGVKLDLESGSYDHGALRSRDPLIGLFFQPEPTGEDGPHLHWFARNNPNKYTDPDGRNAIAVITTVAAAYSSLKFISAFAEYYAAQKEVERLEKIKNILPAPKSIEQEIERDKINRAITREQQRILYKASLKLPFSSLHPPAPEESCR